MVNHYIPTSLQEALTLLSQEQLDIIAGGTDLMVQRRRWADLAPSFAGSINIFHLPELNYLKTTNDTLVVGATTPLADILEYPDTPALLSEAISIIASPALRNVATIAGNIGNASPAGDTLPVLYVHDAVIELQSLSSTRMVPIAELIEGPRKTGIKQEELITAIHIPLPEFTHTAFRKVGGRFADAISKVSFAAAATLKDGVVTDIRLAFGAVGPVVVRDTDMESSLVGQSIEVIKGQLDDIVDHYLEQVTPIDDQRSNKEYRKQVAMNLLMEFILNL